MHKFFIYILISILFGLNSPPAISQYSKGKAYSRADTLRGSMRKERMYDVSFYHLSVDIDIDRKYISGKNDIVFTVQEDLHKIQIDLFANMEITKIQMKGEDLLYTREYNAVFVDVPALKPGHEYTLSVEYRGHPKTASNPPWDGGFVWKEADGLPWVAVACEGIGASLWWPNKDHLSDEPDSMAISISVPKPLFCVSNGTLMSIEDLGEKRKFNWFVHYPINNYNVTLNIADYANFKDVYKSKDGDILELDYYVLKKNLGKAKVHFLQVPGVLEAFEYYFGKYPFWKDGFALVEVPYAGMEHQSAIAYGNNYNRGYYGKLIPNSQNWDYIIVHETGHEYWGNSISCKDHAEMWIHESFTTYLELLYIEYHYGLNEAQKLLDIYRFNKNQSPIRGPLGVNADGSDDMYKKGAWILHTLRNTMENDEQWFSILRNFYQKHQLSNIESRDFFDFVNEQTGFDYYPFFYQYLSHPKIPVLNYQFDGDSKIAKLQFSSQVDDFKMRIKYNKKLITVGSADWTEINISDISSFLQEIWKKYMVLIKEIP